MKEDMKVVVVADHHYFRDADGNVYVPSVYGYDYWKRYLEVFKQIVVVCRGNDSVNFQKEKMLLASGSGVEFEFIYDFSGTKDFLLHYCLIKQQIERALDKCVCAFVRVPSPLSRLAVNFLVRNHKIFACEVAADPRHNYDSLPFAKIVKRIMYRHCRQACYKANGVTYVTERQLQTVYPSRARIKGESDKYFETSYSNANIPPIFFEHQKRYQNIDLRKNIHFIHIANVIEGRAKGHYVCIDIISILVSRGVHANLTFVGQGAEIPKLIQYAEERGVSSNIGFIGRISDMDMLRNQYLKADILLLPSKTEGLPRCIIEAMACGLVCLGSNVGGIPELLDEEDIFEWEDSLAFADRIMDLYHDNSKLENISKKNIEKAERYSSEILQRKRNFFYKRMLGLYMGVGE